jgi:hypothetical protein
MGQVTRREKCALLFYFSYSPRTSSEPSSWTVAAPTISAAVATLPELTLRRRSALRQRQKVAEQYDTAWRRLWAWRQTQPIVCTTARWTAADQDGVHHTTALGRFPAIVLSERPDSRSHSHTTAHGAIKMRAALMGGPHRQGRSLGLLYLLRQRTHQRGWRVTLRTKMLLWPGPSAMPNTGSRSVSVAAWPA